MPRYDDIWDTLARRAVDQAAIDVRALMERAFQMGLSEQALIEQLDLDLSTDGPIFGKFMRSITGAAESSIVAANRQGEIVGHIAEDQELKRLLDVANVDDVIEDAISSADPEMSQLLEEAASEDLEETWVCTLVKTCHRCLPLHGVTLFHSEWVSRGLLPESMHDGWTSSCHCRLVPAKVTQNRKTLREPLVRIKQKSLESARGLRANKRTLRSVLQNDIDRAIESRNQAMQSPEGRRTLRIAGQAETLGEPK